jgi:hypothetical protein
MLFVSLNRTGVRRSANPRRGGYRIRLEQKAGFPKPETCTIARKARIRQLTVRIGLNKTMLPGNWLRWVSHNNCNLALFSNYGCQIVNGKLIEQMGFPFSR